MVLLRAEKRGVQGGRGAIHENREMDMDNINLVLEISGLKREFERRGLDLAQAWYPKERNCTRN